jgi:hypothetical protein
MCGGGNVIGDGQTLRLSYHLPVRNKMAKLSKTAAGDLKYD